MPITASAVGAAFFTTCQNTPASDRPLAMSAETNSRDRMSATSARTVRAMMAVGITDSVTAGRMTKRM